MSKKTILNISIFILVINLLSFPLLYYFHFSLGASFTYISKFWLPVLLICIELYLFFVKKLKDHFILIIFLNVLSIFSLFIFLLLYSHLFPSLGWKFYDKKNPLSIFKSKGGYKCFNLVIVFLKLRKIFFLVCLLQLLLQCFFLLQKLHLILQ